MATKEINYETRRRYEADFLHMEMIQKWSRLIHKLTINKTLSVPSTSLDPYDSDQMARDFLIQFSNQVFTAGQQLAFSFQDKKVLSLVVKNLEGMLYWLFNYSKYHYQPSLVACWV